MKYKLTTYRTLSGTKRILELQKRNRTEAIIYENGKPSYYVNCFDLQTESNVIMNSLVFGQKKSISNVIKEIALKNNVNISVKEAPMFSIKKSFELKEIELPPLPENWLS